MILKESSLTGTSIDVSTPLNQSKMLTTPGTHNHRNDSKFHQSSNCLNKYKLNYIGKKPKYAFLYL